MGRTQAGVDSAEARAQAAVAQYQQTIIQAFREVADALVEHRKRREFRVQQEALRPGGRRCRASVQHPLHGAASPAIWRCWTASASSSTPSWGWCDPTATSCWRSCACTRRSVAAGRKSRRPGGVVHRRTGEEVMVGLVTRPLAIWLVGLGLLVTTAGCKGEKDAKAATPPPPTEVVVAAVEQRAVSIVRDFIARTEAVPTVEVRARVAGILEEVLFKEGMDVKKGQPLFLIQQAEYKAALETARATLAKAQADLTRAKDASIVERVRAPARPAPGRPREGPAGRRPVQAARRGARDPAAGSGHVRGGGESGRGRGRRPGGGAEGRRAGPAHADPARGGGRRVGEGLDHPGGPQPRLHDDQRADRRHHRQDQRRSRQPRGQGGADAARHRVQGEPDLRRFLRRRGRLHPSRAADQPSISRDGPTGAPGSRSSSSWPTTSRCPRRAGWSSWTARWTARPGPSACAPSFPTPTS